MTREKELEALDEEQAKAWKALRMELLAALAPVLENSDGQIRLAAISDEEWAAAEAQDAEGANIGA